MTIVRTEGPRLVAAQDASFGECRDVPDHLWRRYLDAEQLLDAIERQIWALPRIDASPTAFERIVAAKDAKPARSRPSRRYHV